MRTEISDLKKQLDSKKSELSKQCHLGTDDVKSKDEVNTLRKEIEALKKELKVGLFLLSFDFTHFNNVNLKSFHLYEMI